MSAEEWNSTQVSIRKLHERYIGCMLVATIIGLVAVRWGEVPKLTEYLSFALTLASLLLALVAIGYAIMSTGGLERNVTTLGATVEQIRSLTTSLASSTQLLTTDLRSVAGQLDRQLEYQETQKGTLDEIAARIKRPRERRKLAAASSEADTDRSPPIKEIIDYVNDASLLGGIGVYALMLAHLTKQPLDIYKASKAMGLDGSYIAGFQIGARAANVVVAHGPFAKLIVDEIAGFTHQSIEALEKVLLKMSQGLSDADLDMVASTDKDINSLRAYCLSEGWEIPPRPSVFPSPTAARNSDDPTPPATSVENS